MEDGEFRIGIKHPGAVDGVGVGEKDQAVACRAKVSSRFPHWEVGSEDVLPSLVELLRCDVDAECFNGPTGVFIDFDSAGFELVFLSEEFFQGGRRT